MKSYEPTPSDLRSIDEMSILPVIGFGNAFPSSTELPLGVKSVKFSDGYKTDIPTDKVDIIRNVIYNSPNVVSRKIHIIMPKDIPDGVTYPLIAFVPGSAWFQQNIDMSVPEMTRIAAEGYIVAIVEYRGSNLAAFPAQTEDAKTAIRYMRMNAEKYHVNTEKAAICGNSSGGHTAAMVGITGDGVLDDGTYGDYTSEVTCIIDQYGPTDITLMGYYPTSMEHVSARSPGAQLLRINNVLENFELAQTVNPMNYLSADKATPPTLIMHGSSDNIVPFNQSVRLYEKYLELGKDVEMYKLEGAGHGSGGFGGQQCFDVVIEYLNRHLK